MSENDTENVSSPADLAPRLAAIIHTEGFSNRDRATLKRMSSRGPTPLAYHRFLLRHVPEPWQDPSFDLGWRTLIAGLAKHHDNPHTSNRPFGRALAEAGYSELRLERLLAAEGYVLATLSLRASTLLATQRAHSNWRDLAWLLFSPTDISREHANRQIARAFYRTADDTAAAE